MWRGGFNAGALRSVPQIGRAAVTALLVAGLLLVGGCGTAHKSRLSRKSAPAQAVLSLDSRFAGIPQSGDALGSPHAPYTLFEFADLQCPFCARFDRDVLPAVIQRFVRSGRLRIEIHPIVFIGPQSAPAAEAALAAARQNRMWQFTDLFYRNQGRENSGYVTASFIAQIASAVPGLDVEALQRSILASATVDALKVNMGLARASALTGTPQFRFGRTGGVLLPFIRGAWPRKAFLRRLQAAVGARRGQGQ